MLNRRHLRIKIMHAIYAYYQAGEGDIKKADEALNFSIQKMREMFFYLFLLIQEMQGAAIDKIETGRNKKLPTEEDLHPNTKFVTNRPLRILVNSKNLKKELETRSISFVDSSDMVKKAFKALIETEDYKEYMASAERGYDHDREYLLRFFKRHLVNLELLHDYFEEKSIFWNDDLDLVASMVIKNIKLIKEEDDDVEFIPLWKEDDDEEEFMNTLFTKTIVNSELHEKLIEEAAKNWELERIALMDIILMQMALTEAKEFETIPLKVTLNEYIELSKYYSTPKSNGFINGVLDQLFTKLKDDGEIKKIGRGLIE